MIPRRASVSETLIELLDIQTRALLSGDLIRLGEIATPLAKAFDRLRTAQASSHELVDIKRKSRRNAALLTAAQAGLARAHSQISAGRPASLTVYDANGQSHATTPGPGRLLSRR